MKKWIKRISSEAGILGRPDGIFDQLDCFCRNDRQIKRGRQPPWSSFFQYERGSTYNKFQNEESGESCILEFGGGVGIWGVISSRLSMQLTESQKKKNQSFKKRDQIWFNPKYNAAEKNIVSFLVKKKDNIAKSETKLMSKLETSTESCSAFQNVSSYKSKLLNLPFCLKVHLSL